MKVFFVLKISSMFMNTVLSLLKIRGHPEFARLGFGDLSTSLPKLP